MRSQAEVARAKGLFAAGYTKAEIARATGIPYRTISDWLSGKTPNFNGDRGGYECPVCADRLDLFPTEAYVYLLGLYLGDGTISAAARDVYKLRIVCCDAYPELMQMCDDAMAAVFPTKVGRVAGVGCTEVYSHSKHWPCLFPQHGPGVKHLRKIELADWQQKLVDVDPRPLIKGLIHSDGCRVLTAPPAPTTRRIRATTSPMRPTTSRRSSPTPVTRSEWSGGTTMPAMCRSLSVPASRFSTSSSAQNGDLRPSARPETHAGKRPESDIVRPGD